MTEPTTSTLPSAFRRNTRTAAAIATGGMLVGFGSVGITPAIAATAADCGDENTLTAPADGVADLAALLDANTEIICLDGTFTFTADQGPLLFDHNLTIFGLDAAVLDGAEVSGLLQGNDGVGLTVQNLTFVNGASVSGGAISVNGELVVQDSTFENNVATDDGGAIYVFNNAPVTIERSTFANNASQEDGGAVFIQTSDGDTDTSVRIVDSTFTDNVAGDLEGFGYSGGAIFTNVDDDLMIEGSTFLRNSATQFGGAAYGNSVLIDESTFIDNVARAGGAVYGVSVAANQSTFTTNEADEGGAIFAAEAVSTGSTFSENIATFDGGAIRSFGSIVANSTFVENSAGLEGGALFTGSSAVQFSTFLDNATEGLQEVDSLQPSNGYSELPGEAIYLSVSREDSLTLRGNIFAGDGSAAQLGIGSAEPEPGIGAIIDRGGNIFSTERAVETDFADPDESTQFGKTPAQIFGANPALGANGGTTQTLALVAGSPAVDAVPPLAVATASSIGPAVSPAAIADVDVDQRGVERTGLLDAGAFEFGDAELAATGSDPVATGWLAGIAALLLGGGAAALFVSRRSARTRR